MEGRREEFAYPISRGTRLLTVALPTVALSALAITGLASCYGNREPNPMYESTQRPYQIKSSQNSGIQDIFESPQATQKP